MKNLNKTAKTMDIVFRVFQILLTIAVVASIVSICILSVGLAFDLDPDRIGTGYASLKVGSLELELAEDAIPDKKMILLQVGIELLISLFVTGVMLHCVKCIRTILQPMAEGTPFFQGVGEKLKILARNCIILGIGVNILQLVSCTLMQYTFHVDTLLLSDTIKNVSLNPSFDATFLLVGAILLLLSYIFRHGEQLQQEADETL